MSRRLVALGLILPALAFAQNATAPAASSGSTASGQGSTAAAGQAATPPPSTPQADAPDQDDQHQKSSKAAERKAEEHQEEEAGDTSELARDIGPLKNRIPPVTGKMFKMDGRFELTPTLGVSFKDAFFTKYLFGAEATYHFTETLGVGLHFDYAKPVIAGAAQICTFQGTTRGCRAPTMSEVDGKAPGQIKMLAGLDLQWAPIYGKISLLAESFLHFDLYTRVGLAFAQYVGPEDEGGQQTAPGADLGLGMRFFLNRWVTVRTELGDLLYTEKLEGGTHPLRNQLTFQLGISFFFPMNFTEG